MRTDESIFDHDDLDDTLLELLRHIVRDAHEKSASDKATLALLFFLVRAGNTWRSIRTLKKHTEDAEGFMVDAGTLLRAMLDAYFQAAFIAADSATLHERARQYLDFEHVERYVGGRRILNHHNSFSDAMRSSELRAAKEPYVILKFEEVKDGYLREKRMNDGTIKRGPGTRPQWHEGTLRDLAKEVGGEAEYDIFLAHLHGCVHSSPMAVGRGPAISAKFVADWASTIVARIAKLSVDHNRTVLSDTQIAILDVMGKSLFE